METTQQLPALPDTNSSHRLLKTYPCLLPGNCNQSSKGINGTCRTPLSSPLKIWTPQVGSASFPARAAWGTDLCSGRGATSPTARAAHLAEQGHSIPGDARPPGPALATPAEPVSHRRCCWALCPAASPARRRHSSFSGLLPPCPVAARPPAAPQPPSPRPRPGHRPARALRASSPGAAATRPAAAHRLLPTRTLPANPPRDQHRSCPRSAHGTAPPSRAPQGHVVPAARCPSPRWRLRTTAPGMLRARRPAAEVEGWGGWRCSPRGSLRISSGGGEPSGWASAGRRGGRAEAGSRAQRRERRAPGREAAAAAACRGRPTSVQQ